MRPLSLLTLIALLAACSPTFSSRVDDFSVPIANTLGQVCWTRVDTGGAPRIRAATYQAQAIYDPGSLGLTNQVEVQFFGRAAQPAATCTAHDASTDVQLSNVFPLERRTAQPITVGGESYGVELGQLVNEGVFWLGASATDNVGVNERLHFEDGRIAVTF